MTTLSTLPDAALLAFTAPLTDEWNDAETFLCEGCGASFTVERVRGLEPKYCPNCKALGKRSHGKDKSYQKQPLAESRLVVLCVKDSELYLAGHFFERGKVKEDIRRGAWRGGILRGGGNKSA